MPLKKQCQLKGLDAVLMNLVFCRHQQLSKHDNHKGACGAGAVGAGGGGRLSSGTPG